jgi:hypothetical protein
MFREILRKIPHEELKACTINVVPSLKKVERTTVQVPFYLDVILLSGLPHLSHIVVVSLDKYVFDQQKPSNKSIESVVLNLL